MREALCAFQLDIVKCYLRVANCLLEFFVFLLFPTRPGAGVRTLALRTDAIGDTVVSIPALKALHSGREIEVCLLVTTTVNPAVARHRHSGIELLRETGLVQYFIPFDPRDLKKLAARREVRRKVAEFGQDRAVILAPTSQSFSRMLRRLAFIRFVGNKVRPDGWRLTSNMSIFGNVQFQAGMIEHQAVAALRAVGETTAEQELKRRYSCELPKSPDASKQITTLLREEGVPERAWLILMAVCGKVPHRRWPVERFAEVINRLRERFPIYPILIGSIDDSELSEGLRSHLTGPSKNLCGRLSLKQSVELGRQSVAYLGIDSGPAHVMAAAGIPTLTVFSGIHYPGIWEPWSTLGTVVRHRVACQSCKSETHCPLGTNACILGVSVDQVMRQLNRMLDRRTSIETREAEVRRQVGSVADEKP